MSVDGPAIFFHPQPSSVVRDAIPFDKFHVMRLFTHSNS